MLMKQEARAFRLGYITQLRTQLAREQQNNTALIRFALALALLVALVCVVVVAIIA